MGVGRNQPCPCGSGKKYKHCHARQANRLPLNHLPQKSTKDFGNVIEPLIQLNGPKQIRDCEGCTACCGPTMEIDDPDLVVPKSQECPYLCETGCLRWGATQPKSCRAYQCNYLIESAPLTVNERPDKVGAILHRKTNGKTLMVECLPGGLHNVLENQVWGPFICRDLCQGRAVQVTFLDDPYNAEGIEMKYADHQICCALALRNADRSPIPVLKNSVSGKQLYTSPFVKIDEFSFEAQELIDILGERESILIKCPDIDSSGRVIHFLLNRRQADYLNAMLTLVGREGRVQDTESKREGDCETEKLRKKEEEGSVIPAV